MHHLSEPDLKLLAANLESWADLVALCEELAWAAELALGPDEAAARKRLLRRFELQSEEHHAANIRVLEGLRDASE